MSEEAGSGRSARAHVLAVFVVSLALRVVPVDRPLELDEALWVRRGGTFFSALLAGRLEDTYVRPHPGVLSMWMLGSAELAWCRATADPSVPVSWCACAARIAAEPLPSLPLFIVGRLLQAVVTSAAMAAACGLVARLFGARVGWITAAVIVLEPFFVGFQRFVTTDAMAADLSALAWLFFLLYLREGGRARLLLSGAAFGLAAITKIPTILIAPALLLWVALAERGVWPEFARRGWRVRLRDLALWGGAAAFVAFALWPALWVAPVSTLQRMRVDLVFEKTEGAHVLAPVDERPALFYLLVAAWRLSPVLQAGVLLGLGAWIRTRVRGWLPAAGLEPIALLAATSLALLRLAGDTAWDRYILFAVPPLALLSAIGWDGCARWLESRSRRAVPVPALVAALAAAQGAMLWEHAPDYVTFYNPVLGGPAAARHVFVLGSGEGLDRAARWLNEQPGAESLVASSSLASTFAPYFRGRTMSVPMTIGGDDWLTADRIVLYVWQLEVGSPDPVAVPYVWSQLPPLHVVRLEGVDYARIYRGPIVLPAALQAARTR